MLLRLRIGTIIINTLVHLRNKEGDLGGVCLTCFRLLYVVITCVVPVKLYILCTRTSSTTRTSKIYY